MTNGTETSYKNGTEYNGVIAEKEEEEEELIAFARVFSGTLSVGQKVRFHFQVVVK